MTSTDESNPSEGSSPVGRGGAGVYIEGELGAFYLLSMLAGAEARGLPGSRLAKVQFQAVEDGFALDDLVLHGVSAAGPSLLEIQSKRTVTFAPKDTVFAEICRQIARSQLTPLVAEARHGLAVATQRTSYRISGPYQDVIAWAHATASASRFFDRLRAKGVASEDMRTFIETFRTRLVEAGVADEDETIWRLLRRFQILEFDFEAAAPLARAHALTLAQAALAPEDASRAGGLWSTLIEMALAAGKIGSAYDITALKGALKAKGFRLAGDRDFTQARAKLAEMAKHTLATIDATVAGVHLLRAKAAQTFDEARDTHRFVELRGLPGVGKSAFLKRAAEKISREAPVLVLDPVSAPDGGWGVLAAQLGLTGTAREFLSDLALSGGGTLFIDSLEMFTSEGRRRTVNDILREVSAIDGFSIVVTARSDFGQDGDDWLANDALLQLGPRGRIEIGDLDDDDLEVLRTQAPQLRALLAPGHPAAAIAHNLYRLTRLLKTPPTASVHTEAALASHWWATGSDAKPASVRSAQRLLAALADETLAGGQTLHIVEDGQARSELLASLTLRETQRDHLAFYHDVLRDWAVGRRLTENPDVLDRLELTRPVPHTLARGVEFAGRFLLEAGESEWWRRLLDALSIEDSHSSWRRQALLAILRSEVTAELLDRETTLLVHDGGQLLTELIAVVAAVETTPTADLLRGLEDSGLEIASAPRSMRTVTAPTGPKLLAWCIRHAALIPLQALPAVLNLVMVHFVIISGVPALGRSVAKMLFDWLLQLDVRGAKSAIPNEAGKRGADGLIRRIVPDLRTLALVVASGALDQTKAYLTAVADERESYKANAIRAVSAGLAKVVPMELARVVETSLIAPQKPRQAWESRRSDPLTFADADYMPASPAQRPFLDLLQNSKEAGLGLIHKLTAHVIAFDASEEDQEDGFTIPFESGSRFFPRRDSYEWSRGRSTENSVASGLKALEAWGHLRLDAGEPIEDVLKDVLGPDGSCAAFVLVAVDLLISHWPATRCAAAAFMGCPELLVEDRTRASSDGSSGFSFAFQREPEGQIQLKDLQARGSRGVSLEQLLPWYSTADKASERVRATLSEAVGRLGLYDDDATFGDPRLMAVWALNLVTPENWKTEEAGRIYSSPPEEAAHLVRMEARSTAFARSVVVESRIDLAVSGGEHASTELARDAIEYANGNLPDGSDTDYLKTRSTRLVKTALLVARDGDDDLLARHEVWVRSVIDWALGEDWDRGESNSRLEYSRPALATCALAHLWRRLLKPTDRNRLLSIATRKNGAGLAGFEAAAGALTDIDPRIAKSVIRAALATARWRWNDYDEDEAITQASLEQDETHREQAVAAEIAWLGGGAEPIWPVFRPKLLTVRRGLRLGAILSEDGTSEEPQVEEEAEDDSSEFHVDTDLAAQWLALAVEAKQPAIQAWLPEIVSTYAHWTACANGLGMDPSVELERPPSKWNTVFYGLAASVLLSGSETTFDAVLDGITGLPDRSYASVATTFVFAADVWYFNNPDHPAERAVELRDRFVRRTLTTGLWKRSLRPGELSVDHDTGPLVATLLMNSYSPFTETRSYLAPAIFDRIDPLLEPLRPLLQGGPIAFIALCVANSLGVQPQARHAEFLIAGVEAWMTRSPTDTALWLDLGIGRRVVAWLRAAATDSPDLNSPQHALRHRIDVALGRLVAVGVAEAHDLEREIQAGQEA